MKECIQTALGQQPADLVLKHAKVVDVFCHQVVECDVAVFKGRIVGLGEYDGKTNVDVKGQYLMPAFLDAHLHIESSMLTPAEYARIVAPKGVTTLIADPHEIANVLGEAGMRYLFASAKTVPIDIHFMLPSCVPATPYDQAGAVLDSQLSQRLLKEYDFLGLGEMMNVPGVLHGDPEVLKKLSAAAIRDGHAPLLSGKELAAYLCAGIRTDHECTTVTELLEKVSQGMYVLIRQGTGAQNLDALIPGINPYTMRRLLFCTDDRYLGDIVREGSISNCIARAVERGVDPLSAITMASLNAAECYELKGKGAIAPGYRADLVVSQDLTAKHITQVYKDGVLIAQDGQPLFNPPPVSSKDVRHTVHLPHLTAEDFQLPFDSSRPVIQVFPGTLVTQPIYKDGPDGLNLAAVVNRYGKPAMGKAYIDGFGIKGGAIAQTIGHDSHNITVLGDDPADMALAVQALGDDGGMSVVHRGRVAAVLPLPIAGLITDLPAEEALRGHQQVLAAVAALQPAAGIDPFMILSFLSLLVIPEIKLNDSGLFDVNHQRFI